MVLKSPELGGSFYNKSNPIEGIEGIGGEDIRKMLSVIPSRPDYDTWLRIASAVWSQLGMAEGSRLLQEWSPEEKAGEYAAKHKARLKQVGVGTLIYYAKQHGFDIVAWKAAHFKGIKMIPPRMPSRPATPFKPKGERLTFAAPATQTAPKQRIDTAEAERVAKELLKLHEAGLLAKESNADARFFAQAVHFFKGTFAC